MKKRGVTVKRDSDVFHFLSRSIFTVLMLPALCFGTVCANEDRSKGQNQSLAEKLYYRENGELVSEKERTYDENGDLQKAST